MKELKKISWDTLAEILENASLDEDVIRKGGYRQYIDGPHCLVLDLDADYQAYAFFFQLGVRMAKREVDDDPFPEKTTDLEQLPDCAHLRYVGAGQFILYFPGWAPVTNPYDDSDTDD